MFERYKTGIVGKQSRVAVFCVANVQPTVDGFVASPALEYLEASYFLSLPRLSDRQLTHIVFE